MTAYSARGKTIGQVARDGSEATFFYDVSALMANCRYLPTGIGRFLSRNKVVELL